VGLVGLGRVGQAVARRLLAFGATVLAVDPVLSSSPVDGVELVDHHGLADRCDVVSLHAPGGQVLLDRDGLGRLRDGVTIVNTARADLVDEQSMADALRGGHVRAYACDTLSTEQSGRSSPLQAADLAGRVLVTPHLGGHTDEALARMGRMAVDNVLAVLRGDTPPHPVNRPEEVR
jgi:D-3-phosphoglycerate dehydrogenase